MENSKNVLIINDMPGYGKVALAAMLPVLSNLGHSVYNLPTALVSNTLDYGKFTILDTTDYMVKAIEVWKQLGFQFDCITTGFLASAAQVGIIRDFIASQKKEGGEKVASRSPSMRIISFPSSKHCRQTPFSSRPVNGEASGRRLLWKVMTPTALSVCLRCCGT